MKVFMNKYLLLQICSAIIVLLTLMIFSACNNVTEKKNNDLTCDLSEETHMKKGDALLSDSVWLFESCKKYFTANNVWPERFDDLVLFMNQYDSNKKVNTNAFEFISFNSITNGGLIVNFVIKSGTNTYSGDMKFKEIKDGHH